MKLKDLVPCQCGNDVVQLNKKKSCSVTVIENGKFAGVKLVPIYWVECKECGRKTEEYAVKNYALQAWNELNKGGNKNGD